MNKSTLIEYDTDDVVSVLTKQDAPIMESSLISALARRFGYPKLDRTYLYEFHFSLFHILYRIKVESHDMYLHLDPLRIRLIELPEKNECGYYYAQSGVFCKKPAIDESLCSSHRILLDLSCPVTDFMKQFYLDTENISFDETGNLAQQMNKILHYGINKREVDKALNFFGIPYLNRQTLYASYRKLAKKYHPDRYGDAEKMKEVNREFGVLKVLL